MQQARVGLVQLLIASGRLRIESLHFPAKLHLLVHIGTYSVQAGYLSGFRA